MIVVLENLLSFRFPFPSISSMSRESRISRLIANVKNNIDGMIDTCRNNSLLLQASAPPVCWGPDDVDDDDDDDAAADDAADDDDERR